MNHHTHRLVAPLVGALTLAVLSSPAVADEAPESMADRLQRLETQVRALRAARDDTWLTEERADEVRALVTEVLEDADTRASLLRQNATVGYDGGFVIASADGNFRLTTNGQIQLRFNYNNQDDGPTDDDRWGFENRRTKLYFHGHIGDPSWQYRFNGAFSSADGTFRLEDAYIRKVLDDGWSVRAGQFKAPFLQEWLVSDTRLLAVERSLVNNAFTGLFEQGVELQHQGDQWRFRVAVTDGLRRFNTAALDRDTEFALTGRLELLAAGAWQQFSDFTSPPGSETAVLFGASVHYEKQEYGTAADTDEQERLGWTVDASVELDGANLHAALIGNHLDDDTPGGDQDQYGVVVQGGLFVNDALEMFARYEWGDEDSATSVDDLSIVTVGVNRYFSPKIKATVDVGYAFNEVTSTWSTLGAAWRTDTPGDDGQVVVRSQLQLLF